MDPTIRQRSVYWREAGIYCRVASRLCRPLPNGGHGQEWSHTRSSKTRDDVLFQSGGEYYSMTPKLLMDRLLLFIGALPLHLYLGLFWGSHTHIIVHSRAGDQHFFGREHAVAVRKHSWVQDGLRSGQSFPTHWLEPNGRSRFIISTY